MESEGTVEFIMNAHCYKPSFTIDIVYNSSMYCAILTIIKNALQRWVSGGWWLGFGIKIKIKTLMQ